MSSQVEELMPVAMVKGSNMRLFIDHSKPKESSEYNWVEVTYHGKEDSEVLTVPHHWHKDHDEIVEVLEGRLNFYLDGKELIVSAGDPPITVRRRQVHGFSVVKGERLVATERTQPIGESKARFFQDMFQQGTGMPGFLMAMRVFSEGDAYVPLRGGFQTLDYLFITVMGFIARPFVPAKPVALKRKVD